MSYIGSTPTTQSFIAGTDYFNGTGSQTAFTLSRSVVSVNDIEVVINNVEQQPNTAYTVSGTTITFTSAPSAGTANIYVRYLSTTTQSITPSQNTVSYSTLNSDNQSKLGISFKNKIINGAMAISQRGTSFTGITGGPYTLDRFIWSVAANGTWTVTQDSSAPPGFTYSLKAACTTSTGSPNQLRLVQIIEGYNVADLAYGTSSAKSTTFSFWIKTNKTGTYAVSVETASAGIYYHTTFTVSTADTWEQKTITITGSTAYSLNTTNGSGLQFSIWFAGGSGVTSGSQPANTWLSDGTYTSIAAGLTVNLADSTSNYVNVTGVQLEVGTQATTFDYRSYGTELALCQRYYAKMGSTSGNGACGAGVARSSVASNVFIKLPVTMRTIPTISYNTAYLNFNSDVYQPVTSNSGVQGGTDSVNYFPNCASGMTTGYPVLLAMGAGGYVDFSSEL